MLRVKKISKSYPMKPNALKDVDFEVKSGEICVLLGNNGAGKSSIIRSIVGAQDVDCGEIYIGKDMLKEQGISCKKNLGYIPDNHALYTYLTGREYINLISSFFDIPYDEKDERINKYVSLLKLEKAFDNLISTYSKGMKQKLLIVAAIIHQPDVIVMDEPFSGLDPATVELLIRLILEEKKRGAAILFSSHMLSVAEKIADKVIIIKEGMVIVDNTYEALQKQGCLEEILVGEEQI